MEVPRLSLHHDKEKHVQAAMIFDKHCGSTSGMDGKKALLCMPRLE